MPHLLLTVLLALAGGPGPAQTGPGHTVPSAWVAPLGPPLVVLRGYAPPPPAAPWRPGHRGVDLAGVAGEQVRADAAGRVSFAGLVAGQGVVVVEHSARLRSTFEPVLATVHVGSAVLGGAQVGVLATGSDTTSWGPTCPGRPCLHWGMLLDGRYVDPLLTSDLDSEPLAGSARLLPLGLPRLASEGEAPEGVPPQWPEKSAPGWTLAAAALGGGPPGPPGVGATLAVGGVVTTVGAGSVAFVTRRRRRSGREH